MGLVAVMTDFFGIQMQVKNTKPPVKQNCGRENKASMMALACTDSPGIHLFIMMW